ncbi:MAG: PAS domain S-box protein [Candidatus Omnitrophica bacterium]|nr:PAS domain S-box protein [Candidatus Omnitrophota bacterium]
MKAVADQVALAMERVQTKQALQQANEELEQRVNERTAALQEKSRFLEAFFHHSLDSLVFLDKQFNFIRVNETYAKACGRDAAEFIGRSHFELYPHPENQAIFEEVVRTKKPYSVQAKPFVFPDHPEWGVTYWDWTLVPVLDANREVDSLVFSLRDVSKRERAEREVRTASRYARSLIEASLDPLVTISPKGQITDVNQATELVTGIKRDRLIGSDFSDYFTEPEKARTGYLKVISEGWVRDYPLTIRHVSGHTTDVLYNATVYRNEAGQIEGVFAAARDITERKEAEREVRTAFHYARSLLEASLDPLVTISPKGQITDVNQATELVTGIQRDRLIGSDFSDYFTEPDKARAGYLKVISEGWVRDYPLTIRHVSGRTTDVLYNATVYRNEAGQMQGVFAAARDITERKEAERRRDITNNLLELFARKSTAKEYLDSVVEVIRRWSDCDALGIRIADDQSEIPYQAWTGFAPGFLASENRLSLENDTCCCVRAVTQEIEDQDKAILTPGGSLRCDNAPEFINQLAPDARSRYRGNCLRSGYTSLAIIPIRYRDQVLGALHLADQRPGHFTPAKVEFIETMSPLIGEAIHRFHAEAELVRYRDHLEELVKQRTSELESANTRLQSEIVERKRAEESVRRTAEELARSNEDLEQFAYVASHDLQEPLRAVAGFMGLLERRYQAQLDAKAQEYITGAVDGAARMQSLINDLLTYSRIDRGRVPEPVAVQSILDHALANLHASIHETGAVITTGELPTIWADAVQITQLFQNLIGNAIKFRGDKRPEIEIRVDLEPGFWRFAVQDHGIGIDPQYANRIFLIFQRLHNRKQYPGTGIGLAICKKIVERHGGTIWVESALGQGATFYFTIPDRNK